MAVLEPILYTRLSLNLNPICVAGRPLTHRDSPPSAFLVLKLKARITTTSRHILILLSKFWGLVDHLSSQWSSMKITKGRHQWSRNGEHSFIPVSETMLIQEQQLAAILFSYLSLQPQAETPHASSAGLTLQYCPKVQGHLGTPGVDRLASGCTLPPTPSCSTLMTSFSYTI